MQTHLTPLDWAFSVPLQTPVQKAVLLALAKHADYRDFTCFPSIATLARLASSSERTVSRVLSQLEHFGLIVRDAASRFATTIYKLMVGVIPTIAKKKRRARSTPPVQPNLSPPVQPNLSLETPNWHTNSPFPTSQTEHTEERETPPPAAPPPPLEWITFGNGCRATVEQVALLKEHHDGNFDKVVAEVVIYAA